MSSMSPAPDALDAPGQTGDDEANEVTVCIQLDTKTGEFSVGIEPEGLDEQAEEAGDAQWLQPAKDIGDALRMAKQLLESGGGASNAAQDEQQFQQGFASVAGPGGM